MVTIKNRKLTESLLKNFSAYNLMEGFIWRTTNQGPEYWGRLYDDLYYGRPVSSERIEEARRHIRKMLGIIDPSEEAEWE